jgi:hypothetical protein
MVVSQIEAIDSVVQSPSWKAIVSSDVWGLLFWQEIAIPRACRPVSEMKFLILEQLS